jgi:hypothetical protein
VVVVLFIESTISRWGDKASLNCGKQWLKTLTSFSVLTCSKTVD